MPQTDKQFRIVAHHQAFGDVTFIVSAPDRGSAFAKWKQVVYSGKQWIVKSNEEVI